jgi:hypothetical protein
MLSLIKMSIIQVLMIKRRNYAVMLDLLNTIQTQRNVVVQDCMTQKHRDVVEQSHIIYLHIIVVYQVSTSQILKDFKECLQRCRLT